ncbi:glycosyltransferase [Roseofilum sp. BLCC_M154]|uniref:Glycosyltransferase n=1 Tax=Roseofilum acuticapitatum BLCC-M154 TaxID=3022444 RepID=A0ABT7AXK2_9CYAN|nr:glycosyltransferase [Roseofilum acuticapitatum BLCC-M154]
MVAAGHRVDLFARSSYTETPWFSSTKVKGVNVISLPSIPLRGVDAVFNSALGAIATYLRSYDLVHIHALGPALFCWLPKLMGSTTVIVTCHGLDWQRSKWGAFSSRLIHLGEKMAVRYADEITVVSQALQDYFKTTYGIITPCIPNAPATYLGSDAHSTYLQLQISILKSLNNWRLITRRLYSQVKLEGLNLRISSGEQVCLCCPPI